MDQSTSKDRDETRRLLYMVLVSVRSGMVPGLDLLGTLVNALVHHSHLMTEDEALALASRLMVTDLVAADGDVETIRELIAALTAELAEA